MAAREMTPDDPRTWVDWSDPSAHGFLKIDGDSRRERWLRIGATGLVLVAVMWVGVELFVQLSDGGTWRALDLRMLLAPE